MAGKRSSGGGGSGGGGKKPGSTYTPRPGPDRVIKRDDGSLGDAKNVTNTVPPPPKKK